MILPRSSPGSILAICLLGGVLTANTVGEALGDWSRLALLDVRL